MAGGTWTAQNKVRPGAYINFKAVLAPLSNLGIRGIMTMPVALTWGPQKSVIELFSTDLVDGKSLDKIGCYASDPESLIFRQALGNCYKALIYRLDVGGAKASTTSGDLTATAKYYGTSGNKVSFAFIENASTDTMWDVITYFRGVEKYRQTIAKTATIAELENNDWIEWTGTGALPTDPVVATNLEGGTNGTVSNTTYGAEGDGYFALISNYIWNVMAIPQDDATVTDNIKGSIVNFIRAMREDEGKKVQVVLHNANTNYEGVISVCQGYRTTDEVIDPSMFTVYVAGLTAGSEVNVSNTYKVIDNAVSIVYENGVSPFNNATIHQKLANGQFILSTRQDGVVVIEQDINTLHAPYPSLDVNYSFTKNRVIRTLDGISNTITNLFETGYIGKMSNTTDGRNIFKADIIQYLNRLQGISAIQNFNSETDIDVAAGEGIDAVVVNLAVQPVDSMEKLYMTVNVF